MIPLFTLTLTNKGKLLLKPSTPKDAMGGLANLLASTGFKTIHVLHIRTWRTRELTRKDFAQHQVDGKASRLAGVQIHDEEWVCHAPETGQGHIFPINDVDLDLLQEAIANDLYRVN